MAFADFGRSPKMVLALKQASDRLRLPTQVCNGNPTEQNAGTRGDFLNGTMKEALVKRTGPERVDYYTCIQYSGI